MFLSKIKRHYVDFNLFAMLSWIFPEPCIIFSIFSEMEEYKMKADTFVAASPR
jgi:hypothetical protein